MKKQYIYSALILSALLCAGCAKEFENTTDDRNGAAIELSSVSTDPMTKAVITGTSFTTDEAAAGIGLFLLEAEGKAYGNNAGNVRYAHNDGKWTAASPLRVGGTAGTLYGYYPYSSTVNDITAIPVASSVNGTDYLYGSIAGLTSAKAKSENLTLSHALTRLKITFKLDNSFVGSGTLSSLTIEGDGIAASGTLDATTGIVTATKSAFTVSDLNASISTGLTEDCLVVPADASDTPQAVTLKFTVDGKAYKVDLTDGLAVKLQSGIQTDITLTVKNTSVSIDGSSIGTWGDGGNQTVTVGGDYTVTVKLSDAAEDAGIDADVLVNVIADGNSVFVRAYSYSGRHLKYTMDDSGEFCTSQSKTNKLVYTFTLSDIESDITATIGYAQAISPTVSPENAGTIEVEGDLYEGETVILHSKAAYEYGFDRWKDQNGDVLSDDYDYTVRLSQDVQIAACFKENLVLGGVFTVANDDKGNVKKVRFTRGNLYYDNGVCKVEQYLYDGGDYYTNVHVSHFTWCEDIENASKLTYDSSWDGQNTFFANDNDFTVEGFNTGDCFALSKDEWSYLLNGREASTVNGIPNARYFKGCIPNENGESTNGLFILPDAFTWPASVKTQPTGINNASAGYTNTYTYNDFKRLQDTGIIYILAAGYRYNGLKGISDRYRVGYYWSFNYNDSGSAYSLRFDSSSVTPDCSRERSRACAVRLVTEVK